MPDGQHYDDHQTYAGQDAANTKRAMNHMPDEDRTPMTTTELERHYGREQAKELAPHVDVDDRPGFNDVPNWHGYDQDTLVTMATTENDPTTADTLGRAFVENGNELAAAANELNEALTTLDANWEGRAASQARGSIQPLADHSGKMGTSAQLMGASLSQQSAAAQEAQRIPPANNFNKTTFLNNALSQYGGNATADQKNLAMTDANKLQGEADANKAAQVQVMQNYTKAMEAADKMPVFVPPPETISGGGGGGNSSVAGGNVKGWDGRAVNDPSQGTSTGAPRPGSPGVSGISGDSNDQNTDMPTIAPPVGSTSTSGFTGTTPVSPTPGLGGSGPVSNVPHGPSAGSGGFGPSFGNFGGSGSGGPSAGMDASEAGRGAGARGMGAGPMEEAFGRGGRAGGPGGMGGRGGMGAGGGRGANGEEDEEHERPSYLVEPDPDAVFDTDQLTAPPVIGGE